MAQELLATFAEELGSVTLTPDVTGGVFEISGVGQGRFPDIKEIIDWYGGSPVVARACGHDLEWGVLKRGGRSASTNLTADTWLERGS